MARFLIHIDCDNAAFDDGLHQEIWSILTAMRDSESFRSLESSHQHGSSLRDSNGNTVGWWSYKP